MNDYQCCFLLQAVLGQSVNLNVPSEVIKKCVELADKDMMSGGRFICKGGFNEEYRNKIDRVNYVLEVLRKNGFCYGKIDKKAICNKIFWQCDTEKTILVKGKRRQYKPFGLAQKLINMTFKYLYIYKEYINMNIDFSKCECPIDSVVLKRLGSDKNWTRITYDEYEEIRSCIQEKLKKDENSELKEEIGELAFDNNWINK